MDHGWQLVEPANLLKMTKIEGQPWLALFHLMCSNEVRQRYQFTTHRKESILRVRKYLNDVLVDQLPVLSGVQRFMDELAIMKAPDANTVSNAGTNGGLVLEQVRASACGSLVHWNQPAFRGSR